MMFVRDDFQRCKAFLFTYTIFQNLLKSMLPFTQTKYSSILSVFLQTIVLEPCYMIPWVSKFHHHYHHLDQQSPGIHSGRTYIQKSCFAA